MRQRLVAALVLLVLSPWLVARPAPAQVPIRIGYLQAPAALAFIAMRERKLLEARGLAPEYHGFLRPQANIDAFLGGRTDVAIAGSPEPARFRARGVPVKVIACALKDGVYMVAPKGAPIASWADLRGQKVGVPSAGTAAALLTRTFLRAAGLDPARDLELITVTPGDLALADTGAIAAFPTWEPFVTRALATGRYAVVLRYEDDWRKLTGETAPWVHGVIMAREEYLRAHPRAVEIFRLTFFEAVRWVYAHPDEAARLAAPELRMDPAVIRQAMTRTELCREFGPAEKRSLHVLFSLMHALDPPSVGGRVPGPDLYDP
jgi:ABC-type nitrate/sulfonate/bicarbonate transport system substrate-binding protein